MNRRLRIVVVLAIVSVLGCLAVLILRSREPRFQGRTLSEWLRDAEPRSGFSSAATTAKWHSSWLMASNAVNQIGPRAVPSLLRFAMINSSPASATFQRSLADWTYRHPRLHLKIKSPEECYTLALLGFNLLGSNAASAWPILVKRTASGDFTARYVSFSCLIASKPDRETILPTLLRLIHDPNPMIQHIAALVLHFRFPNDAEAADLYKTFPELKGKPTKASADDPILDTLLSP